MTPEQQEELANYYFEKYGQGAYDLASKDINRDSTATDRNLARQQGRFGALSSQKARKDAYNKQARDDLLLKAAMDAREVGYNKAQSELQRKTQLASALTSQGTSGLAQAQQAAQLGQGAVNLGVSAPFLPYQQYGQTVSSAPGANAPTFGTLKDPNAVGAGLGLQSWTGG